MPGMENRHWFTYNQRLGGPREISAYCLNNLFLMSTYCPNKPFSLFFFSSLFLFLAQGGIEGKSYCVLQTEEPVVAYMLRTTETARFSFLLELLQCRNISHVTWSRDHEVRLPNLTLEQPLTLDNKNYPSTNTAYVSQYSDIRAR